MKHLLGLVLWGGNLEKGAGLHPSAELCLSMGRKGARHAAEPYAVTVGRVGLGCGAAVPVLSSVSLSFCNAGVGVSGRQEDFRFCGDRNQTENSSVIYEHSSANISIENTAQALVIRSPFLADRTTPSYQYSLPTTLGRYRFCIYWFKANRTLWLAYGKKSFFLGHDPADGIARGLEKTKASILNVSYVFKGQKNTSLESASEYLFPGKGSSVLFQ